MSIIEERPFFLIEVLRVHGFCRNFSAFLPFVRFVVLADNTGNFSGGTKIEDEIAVIQAKSLRRVGVRSVRSARPKPVAKEFPFVAILLEQSVFDVRVEEIEPLFNHGNIFFKDTRVAILQVVGIRKRNDDPAPRWAASAPIGRSRIRKPTVLEILLTISPILKPFVVESFHGVVVHRRL